MRNGSYLFLFTCLLGILGVFLLLRFLQYWGSRPIKKSKPAPPPVWETDFDDIWSIDDKNDFLIALGSWLSKKSNYGEHPDRFSPAEKAIYIIYQLEAEVNNGGFAQFLYNSSGNFANETAAALRSIGAEEIAAICDRAFSAFGQPIPKDWTERDAFLDDAITDEIDDILSQCDSDFYAYPDNLTELCYDFIMAHREQFTR